MSHYVFTRPLATNFVPYSSRRSSQNTHEGCTVRHNRELIVNEHLDPLAKLEELDHVAVQQPALSSLPCDQSPHSPMSGLA